MQTSSEIYTSEFLAHIRNLGLDMEAILSDDTTFDGAVFYYPDGSLEVRGDDAGREIEERVGMPCRGQTYPVDLNEDLWWTSFVFHGLMHHKAVTANIHCYGEWTKNAWNDLISAVVETRRFMQDVPGLTNPPEEPPDRTLVTITFYRKLKPLHLEVIRDVLEKYFYSVRDAGIGAESPARFREGLSVANKAVQFRLDTSNCGDRTIIWLVMALVRMAENVPLEMISFASAVRYAEGFPPTYGTRSWEEAWGPFDRTIEIQA